MDSRPTASKLEPSLTTLLFATALIIIGAFSIEIGLRTPRTLAGLVAGSIAVLLGAIVFADYLS